MAVLVEAEITSNGDVFVQFFPITLFASIMGITGLSIAYMRAALVKHAEDIRQRSENFSFFLHRYEKMTGRESS